MLTLKVSDRITVTVTDLGISSKDYFIEKMVHEVRDGGTYHRCTYSLSKVDEDAWWLLARTNYGELGTSTRLGF